MTNPDNVGGLPDLVAVGEFVGYGRVTGEPHVRMSPGLRPGVRLFTEDQMREAIELCRAAPAGGEPNGKLVGWWNGITPGFDGMGIPSIRWGADAEDSRHDIPLYDGYNPIHYVTPVSAPAGSGEVGGLARWWQAVEDDMMRDGLSHPDHHVVVRYVGKHERADLTAGDIRAALLRKLQQGADGDE